LNTYENYIEVRVEVICAYTRYVTRAKYIWQHNLDNQVWRRPDPFRLTFYIKLTLT